MTHADTDPRPRYSDALDWVGALVAGVRPEQRTAPTPCPEFDVRTLVGHLVAAVRRSIALGEGRDPREVPRVATDVADDDWAPTWERTTKRAREAWSDPARLDALVTAPWGKVPGRAAVWAGLNEVLVHGWDLAVATGQPAEADPALAQAVLVAAQRAIPAEPRGGQVPFAPPVPPAPNAGPTERLANWSGRSRSAVPGGGAA